MKTEFDLTPNFTAMFDTFEREAKIQSEGFAKRLMPPVADNAEAWAEAKVDILRQIQYLLAPLTVCGQCTIMPEDVLRLRDVLEQTLTSIREQADKLEASLVAEEPAARAEGWTNTFRTSDGYTLHLVEGYWTDADSGDVDMVFADDDGWPVDGTGNALEGDFIEAR